MMIEIYWNSHKKLYSVKIDGKVKDRLDKFVAFDVQLWTSEKGIQRIRDTRRKQVVVTLRPKTVLRPKWIDVLEDFIEDVKEKGVPISFNPYKHINFMDLKNDMPVKNVPLLYAEIVDKKPRMTALLNRDEVVEELYKNK